MSFTCEELDYLDSKAESEAALIRQRIEATVVRRVPQVLVKVTGGGRGMKAIAAHFRYVRSPHVHLGGERKQPASEGRSPSTSNLGRKVLYSITPVACSNTLRGKTTPSARAVRRLTTKS